MKRIILFFAFILTMGTTNAQIKNLASQAIGSSAGTFLTQFANNIKPSSFLSNWAGQKTNWLAGATKVTDAIGLSKNISSLAGFIKPELFKSAFNLANFQTLATKVKTMTEAASLFKNLESNLKPEAFGTNWSKLRGGWLSGLTALK